MGRARASHILLSRHVAREFSLNFLVAFVFFFFIFFINQILLLVREVMLRSVGVADMLSLVVCAIPQFLQYVVPFATLSASSMVLGDLGSNNELLALRANGIGLNRVYRVLAVLASVLSLATFGISDYLMPASAKAYQNLLAEVMRELPTFEISANTINTVGGVIMRNGDVEGSGIHDILLMNNSSDPAMSVASEKGSLELIDSSNFVYRLSLDDASILLTENDISRSLSADSSEAVMYLDFSNQVPALTDTSPSNLSTRELKPLMDSRREMRDRDRADWRDNTEDNLLELAASARATDRVEELASHAEVSDRALRTLSALGEDEPIQFYFQYYSAEYNKKFALALGCLALTFVTFPLSMVRIRHGRLVGFGLSLLIAVLYWYILFFSQLQIFNFSFNAGFLMYVPDASMFLIGLVLLFLMRRST